MTTPSYVRIQVVALLALMLLVAGLSGQDSKARKEPSDKEKLTFKLPVGVVVVSAKVTDKDEAAVTDLTQKDFRVYEDGKLRDIQTLALESYRSIKAGEAAPQRAESRAATTTEPDFTRPRMISIMIDDIASTPDDHFIRVTDAVAKFVESDMGPGDQIEIMSGSGRVQYPFSNDKQLLLEEVASLPQKLNWNPVSRSECPVLTDLQAQMLYNGHDDGGSVVVTMTDDDGTSKNASVNAAVADAIKCLNLDPSREQSWRMATSQARMAAARQYQETEYRNRTLLQTLRQHLRSLRHFDATKSAILFSDGFLREDVTYELQDVVEQGLRSGVVLNTVDIRGLYTYPFPSARDSDDKTFPYKQGMYMQDAMAQEDPLSQLASETGGIFFHNSNDIYGGIREISSRQDSYYVLTYAIPQQKADGRYHSIKVEVTRPGLKVSYRKGYYAPKEEMTFERQKKEDILEALRAPGNLNEIPMSLSYNYYQDDDTTYVVSLLTKVDIRDLRFLDEDSRHKNLISMVVVAFDETDHYISGLEKSVDFRLTDASYASLLDRGLISKIEFKLTLGRYKIKAIVREASEGKMGSLTKVIEIP